MLQTKYWMKYDARTWLIKRQEISAMFVARNLPKWLRYWVVMNEAINISLKNPDQEVPSITWEQMAKNILG